MKKDTSIVLFKQQQVRRHWDEERESWYFSVVDIIEILTDSSRPRKYWSDLKKKLLAEGSQLSEKIGQLKMLSPDGKKYLTDVADTETVLRLIQSIPSPKAEPFKLWLAKVGYERIDSNNRLAIKGSGNITIQCGDVLINGTGVGTIGRCAPYLRNHEALPDNHVTILRPSDESIDPVYLSVFLNSIAGQSQIDQWFRGSSGQIELYPDDIAKFTIWQAPDDIQTTIRSHIEDSFKAKTDAAHLLECAKRAVEIAIEQDQQTATQWLQAQTPEVL
ncbi:MAG: hypothetical protein JKY87_02805 [Mariprofundus sp.]|nr:hypothetical protein [Mariprofundus sp.]